MDFSCSGSVFIFFRCCSFIAILHFEGGRLTAHDPGLVKAPHWVAYDDEACQKLEAAYAAGVPDIVSNVGPARDVSVKTMKQINRKTGFERDVLRE